MLLTLSIILCLQLQYINVTRTRPCFDLLSQADQFICDVTRILKKIFSPSRSNSFGQNHQIINNYCHRLIK